MMGNQKTLLLSTLSLAILTACGGSETSNSVINIVNGSVLDGYINGAIVCLDTNSNGACDANEPFAKTGTDGKYKLDIGSIASAGLNLVVEIPETAKDSDDNGKTLKEAGKLAYTMATTADLPSVITPLTTLVVGKVKTDKISVADAKSKVLKELGLPDDTNLQEDHVQSGNALVHSAARETAARLQKAQASYDALPANERPKDKLSHVAGKIQKDDGELGKLVKSTTLNNLPSSVNEVGNGQSIIYKMRSVKGELINASAMLLTPKTAAPSGGWPLLVFGHGTTGIDSSCAPSRGNNLDYLPLLANLMTKQVAVLVPDYEGRGPVDDVPNAHPYLHLGSAGQSMGLSAVAAKNLLKEKLSGSWAAMGHSQGGHAALAAAQYSDLVKSIQPSLSYKGAVAVAPASNLVSALNMMFKNINDAPTAPESFVQLGTLNFYASYLVQGSSFTNSPIEPKVVFGERMQAVHKKANTCLNAYINTVSDDVFAFAKMAQPATAYTGVIAVEINKPTVANVLRAMEPGTVKLPGKTLIVQGESDTTVLPAASNALQTLMKAKGSDTNYQLIKDVGDLKATHSGVLSIPAAQQVIATHINTLFAPVP